MLSSKSIKGRLIATVVISQALLAAGLLFAGVFYTRRRLVATLDAALQSRASDSSPGTGLGGRSLHRLGKPCLAGSDLSVGTLWNSPGPNAAAALGRTGSPGLGS